MLSASGMFKAAAALFEISSVQSWNSHHEGAASAIRRGMGDGKVNDITYIQEAWYGGRAFVQAKIMKDGTNSGMCRLRGSQEIYKP